MALTKDGLDYIAKSFGINDCWVDSGLSWASVDHDGNEVSESGGTKSIVGRLINDTVYAKIKLTSPRTGTYTKSQLISANNNQPVTLPDVKNADPNYCVGVTLPPPGKQPVTPPFKVYVGGGISCDPGAPSVTLDTSEAFAYFKAQPVTYVGVMDILVHNLHNECFSYFAWEMRLWDGYGYTECPQTTPELQEISRFLGEISDKKVISITRTNASENKMIGGSFEVPSWMEGEKTICLSLWGNFSKDALIDELEAAGYAKEIPW